MKTLVTLGLVSLSTFLTHHARAAEAPAPGVAACVVGAHTGIADADAFTVAALVCDQVRAQGQPLAAPVAAASAPAGVPRFVVEMQTLGESVILGLSQSDAAGIRVAVRTLNLARIEDAPVAAPRLADAVLRRVTVEDTRQTDNLLGSEVRVLRKIDGETTFGLGVLTGMVVGSDASDMLVGAEGHVGYELGQWGIDLAMRVGGASSDRQDGSGGAALFGLSVGGRRFFQPGDGSLFVGTGLGFDMLATDLYDDVKPVAYAEAGYEVLRLTESRLSLSLRADFLLGMVEGSPDWNAVCDEYGCTDEDGPVTAEDGYLVPLTLGLAYAF